MSFISLSVVLGGLTFLVPNASPFEDFGELPSSMVWILEGLFLFSLILTPFMVAGVISFQAINPFSADKWTPPSHYANPLNLKNPLLFFHFASYAIIAQGSGVIATSFMGGIPQLLSGLMGIAGGVACLAGVHLSMRWCKNKMEISAQ